MISLGALRTSKREMMEQILRISDMLRRLLPLDETRALNVVATATSMAGVLWQMAAPDNPVARALRERPRAALRRR